MEVEKRSTSQSLLPAVHCYSAGESNQTLIKNRKRVGEQTLHDLQNYNPKTERWRLSECNIYVNCYAMFLASERGLLFSM